MRKHFATLLVVSAALVSQHFAAHSGFAESSELASPSGSAVNRVLSLDGKTGYMQVADSESLHSFREAITVEAWIKAASFYVGDGQVNSILRKNIASGAENFLLRFRTLDGEPLAEMNPGVRVGIVQAPYEFTTGTWYHLAGTYDGKAITVYVNGVKVKSQPFSGPMYIDKSDLFIGKGDPEFSFGEYLHGLLDEIRLWNLARSPEQVRSSMNTPLTGKEPGLVLYMNFDDGTARDLSPNGNNGTLHEKAAIVEQPRPTVRIPEGQTAESEEGAGLTTERHPEVPSVFADVQPDRYIIPTQLPQTRYSISANFDTSNNRLEGREEIYISNPSIPLKRLVIDRPSSSGKVKILYQGSPIRSYVTGEYGISQRQMLIELPQVIEPGGSMTLEIEFDLALRLDAITKLTGWFPRLWWGRDVSDDFEVKINPPGEYLIATSGVFDMSRNCYVANGCRQFGLVLMKDLKVLKTKSGDTEIYSYFDEESRECVEFTHQTAVDVINFYREWLGFYPHKALHIVPGGLSHPAGGYPVATAIVGIHGQKQFASAPKSHWQFITAHEIGHQYWIEHVLEAPDTFWLMIGLGVYADRAFMLARGYGDEHERNMIKRYIQGTREILDTRMDRLPEDMKDVDFDYNNVVNHGKGFGVISALACTMGKDTFDSAYKRCLEEFKGRTLDVHDFQRVCEEESGQTLNWFFDQWVRTSRYLSYEIASHETASKEGCYVTTARVKKLGTLSMPAPVTATFEDGASQCLYTDRLLDECTLVFTSQTPLKQIKLDAHNELPLVVPPPDPVIAQLKKAIEGLDFTGEGNKALQIFDRVKKIKLEGADFPWFGLGMHLYDEKHDQEALEAFQNESKQSPESFIGFVWQGHIHDLMNHREEALKCYQKALAMNPRTWVRHDQWGMKIDRSWIEKRIESPFQRPDPTLISLKNRIATLEWTGEGEKALQIVNELKSIKLDDADFPWGKLGLCLYDGKHYEEALQVFRNDFEQQTKTNSPYAFGSLVWQGHLYDLMDQRDKALECYERALGMKPESQVRHDQYGLKVDLDWIKARLKSPFQRD